MGTDLRVTDLYAVGSFDPDHDAVMRIDGEAPGGGPILSVGIKRQVRIRFPATSDRQFGTRAESRVSAENGAKWYARSGELLSGRWTEDDAVQWLISRDKAPQRNDQFASQRDDHGLARANTAVSGASAVP